MNNFYSYHSKNSTTVFIGQNRFTLHGESARLVNDIVVFAVILSALITIDKAFG